MEYTLRLISGNHPTLFPALEIPDSHRLPAKAAPNNPRTIDEGSGTTVIHPLKSLNPEIRLVFTV